MALRFTNRPALVAYITCGDPDLRTSREVALAAASSGAEVIELGVPFSDPVADGGIIQRASERALRNRVSLGDVLALARDVRRETAAGLIVFSYLNPVLQMGIESFASRAADAGLDGALVIDLPTEEAAQYCQEMRKRELATIFLAAPTSTEARLRRLAEASTGFVYAVSRTGVTGKRAEFPPDAEKLVSRVRRYTRLPIAVGFGISSPAQVRAVAGFADAAVVGSAIVEKIEANPGKEAQAVAEFLQQLLRAPTTELGMSVVQSGRRNRGQTESYGRRGAR
ncbi:MAG: tryptophan synthase subunit alpha [Acidobacteria bacterium]|nr:tryptophan synthase subunit alpha [Acidobacteriota bacterium]